MKQSNFFQLAFQQVIPCWFIYYEFIFEHWPPCFIPFPRFGWDLCWWGFFLPRACSCPPRKLTCWELSEVLQPLKGRQKRRCTNVSFKCVWHCTAAANLELIEVDLCCAVITTARFWVWGREYVLYCFMMFSLTVYSLPMSYNCSHSIRSLFKAISMLCHVGVISSILLWHATSLLASRGGRFHLL